MTMVPYGPLWTWNLIGEDAQYFSQPTQYWYGTSLVPLTATACVARCTRLSRLGDAHGLWTPPIQCGRVATSAPDGTYLCDGCVQTLWECEACDAWMPEGTGGCCEACKEERHGY